VSKPFGIGAYAYQRLNLVATQLGRSLSKLAFDIGREDWEPEQDAERLLRLVNDWQEGVRKRAQKKTKARIAESKSAA
jgi:hypothetical protein